MSEFALVLINGPQPGLTIELGAETAALSIGRDAARDLPLDDQLASRLHARIVRHSSGWQIEDCGSRNGTLVNGQPIEQAMLEVGDLIRIGGRLIVFTSMVEGDSPFALRPSQIAATTFAVRIREPAKHDALMEQVRVESSARPVRDSALLCRLATGLHQCQDLAELVSRVVETLQQGTRSGDVRVWLVGVDGRLRRADVRPDTTDQGHDAAHVLASLSWENNEALLLGTGEGADASLSDPAREEGPGAARGTSIAVPIPGHGERRGAIECHRCHEDSPYDAQDLDLAIAVANQAGMALENLEHRERLELANAQLRDRIDDQVRLVGSSPRLEELKERIARVAETKTTLLVLGETGSGKELVAATVHELSPRRVGPFVAVNCAAFSESLLESELFGHEAGAFTGAERRRAGQFERAHRGTIFLDEVGEMSAGCQAKLLRVLEGQPFERLGGSEPVAVDVRIVAATHRDLAKMVAEGTFREDLYYRLRVIELNVPPLRERGDDVLVLATAFLEQFRRQLGRGPKRLSESAAALMSSYHWPGNVRELRNAIERAVVLAEGEAVEPEDLGLPQSDQSPTPVRRLMTLAEAESQHIRYVLDQVDGNKTQACKVLGIGRATLYKRLEAESDEA